ncbi:hypothetical protein RSAG8_12922, partial [Rhizoctonia solani AG-8 WAC10335]
MDSSTSPASSRLEDVEKTDELVAKVDPAIKVISDQLFETRLTLEWTRKRLASPIHRLPEEMVSTIFMNVIFDFSHSDIPDSTLMEQNVYEVYRSTRELGPFKLSLKRAGGSNLHLVAVADSGSADISKNLTEVLTEYSSRFYAINLSIRDPRILVDAVDKLLQEDNTGSLTKLSIRCVNAFNNQSWLPSDDRDSYVFHHDDLRQILFTRLVGALRTFRINGVHFHWQATTFSTRLNELWIENITLGYDDAVVPFLQALSSASELRDLKIITVDTFCRRNSMPGTTEAPSRVVFPNLQSLYIRDIYSNTLKSLLRMITPGSYHLTLFLRETSLQNNLYEHDFDEIEINHPEFGMANLGELCKDLERVPVHTLMLSEHSAFAIDRLTAPTLQLLLKAMPTLKTLKMHRWVFDEALWDGLKQPHGNQADLQERNRMAALEYLQLSEATILTDEGFQDLVASHPLQRVVLGATIAIDCSDDTTQKPLEEGNRMVGWLKDNLP